MLLCLLTSNFSIVYYPAQHSVLADILSLSWWQFVYRHIDFRSLNRGHQNVALSLDVKFFHCVLSCPALSVITVVAAKTNRAQLFRVFTVLTRASVEVYLEVYFYEARAQLYI